MLDRYPDAFAGVPGSTEHDGAFIGPDDRVYVTGSVVSTMDMMGEVFDTCPIAAIRDQNLGYLWHAWRAYEKGCLSSIEPEPSALLMGYLDEMARCVSAVERRVNSRALAGKQSRKGKQHGER